MLFKIMSLMLVNMGMSQYVSQYEYTTSWDDKRRLVVVQGDSMVRVVKGSVQAEGMNCQLATRNLNILYLSGDQPQDVAFHLNRSNEVKELSNEVVDNVKRDIGRGSGDWAVLVGYDGGVKMVMREQIKWEDVFNKIDGMPMRRREMRNGAICP